MNKYIFLLLILCCCSVGKCDEWVKASDIRSPVAYYQHPVPCYYYSPQVVIVPVSPLYYTPIVTYSNIVVEKQSWCLLKKYEIIPVANTVYIPVFPVKAY